MGGSTTPATVTFRGVTVDPATADALTELARIVGDDIYLRPIPGCGSYQTSTAASAGTHAGGGAVDIDCEGLTDEQARRIETRARQVGFVAYFRPRVSPYSGRSYGWQRHVHAIRRDCTDLAPSARAQITAYDKGLDALAVPHKDTGSRAYVGATWATYKAAQRTPAPTPTPAQVAPREDEEMALLSKESQDWIEGRLDAHDEYVLANLKATIGRQVAALADVNKLAAAVVAKLPANNLTADDVKAALGAALAESVTVTGSLTVEQK